MPGHSLAMSQYGTVADGLFCIGEKNLWRELRPIAQNATTINRQSTAAAVAVIIIIICLVLLSTFAEPGMNVLACVSMIQRRHFWRYEPRTLCTTLHSHT